MNNIEKLLKVVFLFVLFTGNSSYANNQLNHQSVDHRFQKIVTQDAYPTKTKQDKIINIALIYPGEDTSDFWVRNYAALTARLDALGLRYNTQVFSSKPVEHALQTLYTTEVLQKSKRFDYVIFKPTELDIQANNIQRLVSSTDFSTFIWGFHTPIETLKAQPTAWFDFSSSAGAKKLCQFVLKKLGNNIKYVMNRGVPSITDVQRSEEFKRCVEDNGDWEVLYEHYGLNQQYGGADGADIAMTFFPKTQVLYNANAAMAVGAAKTINANAIENKIYITGWGGTKQELDLIKKGALNVTPMRISDDIGVATAEAIKLLVEKRDKEVPFIYFGRITLANNDMPLEVLERLENEAFRYSNNINPDTTTK